MVAVVQARDQARNAARARSGRTPSELLGVWLMIVLTLVTGIVDAVGYLALDRVFTGNMTGNIVILGMAVAGADELPILGPAVALGTFTVGAFLAGLALRRRPSGWSTAVTIELLIGAVLLAAVAVLLVVTGPDRSEAASVVAAAVTALVMGGQAATARKIAVRDMTTVVVTSTLASFAGESLVGGGRGSVLNRRFAAILIIFLGALLGAVLLQVHPGVPTALAAASSAVVALIGHLRLRPA